MASLIKQAKRGLRRSSGQFLSRALTTSPPWLRSKFAPALCYVEMLIVDYGFVRSFYGNRHQISKDAWRSAQPAPRQIASMARLGVKSIINLRGEQTFGTRWLEQRACERHNIKMVDFKLRSRVPPTRADLLALKDLIENVEYPILVHCKSGADRAGLMSVMVKHVHDGQPIAEAKKQLSLRYGHIKMADTGVLDAVFERYLEDAKVSGIAFWDWVETKYDPDEIHRSFKANGWANRIVNGLLRRE